MKDFKHILADAKIRTFNQELVDMGIDKMVDDFHLKKGYMVVVFKTCVPIILIRELQLIFNATLVDGNSLFVGLDGV